MFAVSVGERAMNPFLGQEEAARIQYANFSGRTQYNAMMGAPSSSLNRPIAPDGDNAILAALAKIQASVTDIAVKQDDIFQRLAHLEGARNSGSVGSSVRAVDGERGGQLPAPPVPEADNPDSGAATGRFKGIKRKADGSNENSGRQGRPPGAPRHISNSEASVLSNRPRSEGEGSNAMRLVTFYDASHRSEDQQIRAPEGEEHPGFGGDTEIGASARGRLPAPDQTKIMTEVRAHSMQELHICSVLQPFETNSIRRMSPRLTLNHSIVTGPSPPRLGLQMQTRLQSAL